MHLGTCIDAGSVLQLAGTVSIITGGSILAIGFSDSLGELKDTSILKPSQLQFGIDPAVGALSTKGETNQHTVTA